MHRRRRRPRGTTACASRSDVVADVPAKVRYAERKPPVESSPSIRTRRLRETAIDRQRHGRRVRTRAAIVRCPTPSVPPRVASARCARKSSIPPHRRRRRLRKRHPRASGSWIGSSVRPGSVVSARRSPSPSSARRAVSGKRSPHSSRRIQRWRNCDSTTSRPSFEASPRTSLT